MHNLHRICYNSLRLAFLFLTTNDKSLIFIQVMHYLDTLPPEELLAQVLTTSYLLVADGLKQSLITYMVPPSLAQQLEELYATMASLLPSLGVPSKIHYTHASTFIF